MIGEKFNRLTILEIAPSYKRPCGTTESMVICQCECGTITPPKSYYKIKKGVTKSCGCLSKESFLNNPWFAKGHSGHKITREKKKRIKKNKPPRTSTYYSWASMRKRCNNPKDVNYKYYGAKGVTVCDRWNITDGLGQAFKNFVQDLGERPKGKTLDRINPYGNYEPSNCRWATPIEQARNKRRYIQKP